MNNFIPDSELLFGIYKDDLIICGVDEAGRGPLCGPVSAAAVIMPKNFIIEGVTDSKKISEKKRELLYPEIIKNALAYSICFVDSEEIDKINILNASLKAMETAINNLKIKPDYALIDGNQNKGITTPNKTVVKGDSKSFSIACASILAKVERDRYMIEMDKKYPEYNFAKHKGYGTKEHYEAIKTHGILEIHRKTFLKNWFPKD